MLLGLILTWTCILCFANSQYLSSDELAQQTCFASSSDFYALHIPQDGYPASPVILYNSSTTSTFFFLQCAQAVVKDAITLSAAEKEICQSFPATRLYACTTSITTLQQSCDVDLAAMLSNPKQNMNISRSFEFFLTIYWMPNASVPTSCYPRFVTSLVLIYNPNAPPTSAQTDAPTESSLATVIVFVCIAGFVVIVIIIFAQRQLRKVFSKLQNTVSTKPRLNAKQQAAIISPPPTKKNFYEDEGDDDEHKHGAAAGEQLNAARFREDLPDEEFRAVYGNHAIRSRGAQATELVDGVVVTSKPLVQPWYQRSTYINDGSHPTEFDGQPRPLKLGRVVPPNEPPQAFRQQPRRSSPARGEATGDAYSPNNIHNNSYVPTIDGTALDMSHSYADGVAPMENTAGGTSPLPNPRRLQFPSPVHIRGAEQNRRLDMPVGRGGSPPTARMVLNPYDELGD